MVGGYFADMQKILISSFRGLRDHGECWMVVGDSQYQGVHVPVAAALLEIAMAEGFDVVKSESTRSMRNAPQQGGNLSLDETLVVLRRPALPNPQGQS
jgi:hypothetical protein